jgi:NADH:ubiquinone oxidoreductase subunit
MKLFQFLGVLSPVYIWFFALFSRGRKRGVDACGNRYYESRPRKGYKLMRRWVLYKGEPEASRVPPEYHGWLHHQTDIFPGPGQESSRRAWQTPHRQNLTGTVAAYRPPGHILEGGRRAAATGDYEPWKPSD